MVRAAEATRFKPGQSGTGSPAGSQRRKRPAVHYTATQRVAAALLASAMAIKRHGERTKAAIADLCSTLCSANHDPIGRPIWSKELGLAVREPIPLGTV